MMNEYNEHSKKKHCCCGGHNASNAKKHKKHHSTASKLSIQKNRYLKEKLRMEIC